MFRLAGEVLRTLFSELFAQRVRFSMSSRTRGSNGILEARSATSPYSTARVTEITATLRNGVKLRVCCTVSSNALESSSP